MLYLAHVVSKLRFLKTLDTFGAVKIAYTWPIGFIVSSKFTATVANGGSSFIGLPCYHLVQNTFFVTGTKQITRVFFDEPVRI